MKFRWLTHGAVLSLGPLILSISYASSGDRGNDAWKIERLPPLTETRETQAGDMATVYEYPETTISAAANMAVLKPLTGTPSVRDRSP